MNTLRTESKSSGLTNFPRIGLALGSGGAKGLAHIGVIKVLERHKIPIFCIAGSSIGALVGSLYAAYRDIGFIENLALSSNWKRILSFIMDPCFGGGFLSGKKVENFIRAELKSKCFSDLSLDFSAVATDLKTGEAVILRDGDVATAVRASISVPLVFKPIIFGDYLLADGGLSEPVPVQAARALGADFVIAVNLDTHYFSSKRSWNNLYQVAEQSVNILRYHKAKSCVLDADIVVEPEVSMRGFIGWKEFLLNKKIIQSGEKAMEKVLPLLRQRIFS